MLKALQANLCNTTKTKRQVYLLYQQQSNLQTQVVGLVDVTVEMSSADSFVIWSAGPLAVVEEDASTSHPFATV